MKIKHLIKPRYLQNAITVYVCLFFLHSIAQPVSINPLVTFDGSNGDRPYGGLALGNDGNFYGTTEYGGSNNFGTIFKMSTTGTLIFKTSFTGTNGAYPHGSLIQGNDGSFYGTTFEGGSNDVGTVFKVTTNGFITSLASFNNTNGAKPLCSLLLGNDGNFYGTTEYGGTSDYGTLFQMTSNGTVTSLMSFTGTNGQYPVAGLAMGPDGAFYGTTVSGGSNNYGTVFKITTNGAFSSVASFSNTNGANPWCWLTLGNDGNFYGTTIGGGTNASLPFGTIFKISINGTLNSLFSFDFSNGGSPYAGLTKDPYGNFYGTTTYGVTNSDDSGTLFTITTNGILTTLFDFSVYLNDGENPFGNLVFDASGNTYGTAYQGGQYGHGTVFKVSFPVIIEPPQLTPGNISLKFKTISGKSYSVQQISNLASANWTVFTNITGTGSSVQIFAPLTNGSTRFFRIGIP